MGVKLFNSTGLTLIELIVSMTVLSVLAMCVVPLSRVTHTRAREMELKRNLRAIRGALDEYKSMVDRGLIAMSPGSSGYPESLELLVEGVPLAGPVQAKKRFLRRIPRDPMTEEGEWGLRSYFDDPDSDTWGGRDVYDVYSKSEEEALDGTLYRDW